MSLIAPYCNKCQRRGCICLAIKTAPLREENATLRARVAELESQLAITYPQEVANTSCNQLQNPTIVCLKVGPTKGVTILAPTLTEEASKLPPGEYELVVRRVGS